MKRVSLLAATILVFALAGCGPMEHKPCGTADHGKTVQGPTRYESYHCVEVPGGEWQWEK